MALKTKMQTIKCISVSDNNYQDLVSKDRYQEACISKQVSDDIFKSNYQTEDKFEDVGCKQ